MYKIIFNDGKVELLVATETETIEECNELISEQEKPEFYHIEPIGCDHCQGDEALYWKDEENNAFVDSKGEVFVTVNGKIMRFKVRCCPNCGNILAKEQER